MVSEHFEHPNTYSEFISLQSHAFDTGAMDTGEHTQHIKHDGTMDALETILVARQGEDGDTIET